MCGIAGWVGSERVDPDRLRAMCDVIRHRGPDDDGYFLGDGVGLGMRRLAIIDLHSGRQPIANEDETVWIVYNGELYNFPELRSRLEAAGHRFRTNTDTECIVHLYEDHGDRCVEHLRGMFAFAIWDNRRRRLLLARDRVGKKPLYYHHSGRSISFGSELKALLQDPSLDRTVDLEAVHHFLTYQYVPAPWSILQQVKKLPPAHTLSFEQDTGDVAIRRYWTLAYEPKLHLTEQEAVPELRARIADAVACRLTSDRPIGAFLSGGIDSSVVVAAMAECMTEPVKTFSIGFEEDDFDERRHARKVAERFATDHHELVVRPSALDDLDALTWYFDEPFADASALPSYYLAKMTRAEVTVALNGDGGDECFGGYGRYLANLRATRWAPPARLHPALRRLANAIPASRFGVRSPVARAQRAFDRLVQDPRVRYGAFMAYFDHRDKMAVYSDDMVARFGANDSFAVLNDRFDDEPGYSLIDAMLHVDVETYLPGDLLVKMDRASMANSLEARSPFLDHELMEFAARLPSSLKIAHGTGKYLLKQVARGWLPREILDRPKMGFGVPMGSWLRNELRPLARETLTDRTFRDRGLFDPDGVARLLAEHDSGLDNSTRIWALIQLERWMRMFVDERAATRPTGVGGAR